MNEKKCYLYGAGGHSNVVTEVLAANGIRVPYKFDDNPSHSDIAKPGILLAGIEAFPKLDGPLIITVGRNEERAYLANHLNVEFATTIHPTAIVSPTATVGVGTVVLHGAIIQSNTSIGAHVLINTAASVDHDNVIGDFAHISPHATLCGHVEVGEGTHIGACATIIPKVKVGKWCTVGAGSVVIRDVPDYSTVVGNPARVIKTMKLPDRLLDQTLKSGNSEFDLVFVGAGLSTTMALINLVKRLMNEKINRRIKIAVIEKSGEFFAGIAYGDRAGFNSLIITSLKDFLPEPQLSEFKYWLNGNIDWIFDKFNRRKGSRSSAWLELHREKIYLGQWDDLFVPRYLFGLYLKNKTSKLLNEAKRAGLIHFELVQSEVTDISKIEGKYLVKLNAPKIGGSQLTSHTIVLGLGTPPIRKMFDAVAEHASADVCLIDDQYDPGLTDTIGKVVNCLENYREEKSNVLLIGSNASAIETLYNLIDFEQIHGLVNKYYVISPSGEFPERMNLPKRSRNYLPMQLKDLQLQKDISAKAIYEAAKVDVVKAQADGLTFADTFGPVSVEVGKLLPRLSEAEQFEFANVYGVELGKLQRRAGDEYRDVVEDLIAEGKLELIIGRFEGTSSVSQLGAYFEYFCPQKKQTTVFSQPVRVAINCCGFEQNNLDSSSELIRNLIRNKTCQPTSAQMGLLVDDRFQANENLFVIGPMLAGNVVSGRMIWHVEHCGRIIAFGKEISNHVFDCLLQASSAQ